MKPRAPSRSGGAHWLSKFLALLGLHMAVDLAYASAAMLKKQLRSVASIETRSAFSLLFHFSTYKRGIPLLEQYLQDL